MLNAWLAENLKATTDNGTFHFPKEHNRKHQQTCCDERQDNQLHIRVSPNDRRKLAQFPLFWQRYLSEWLPLNTRP